MADPEQPDYLALLVWIQSLRRGDPPPMREGMTSTHFDDLIKTLDGILAKEPRYERALQYRGTAAWCCKTQSTTPGGSG